MLFPGHWLSAISSFPCERPQSLHFVFNEAAAEPLLFGKVVGIV